MTREENFQVYTPDGRCHWVSRSVAVVIIPIFFQDGSRYLPLGLRAKGTAEGLRAKGTAEAMKWSLPCGFLDWGESACDAAYREMLEETGIDLHDFGGIPDQPHWVESDPRNDPHQAVRLRFIVTAQVDRLPEIKPQSDDIVKSEFVRIDELKNYELAFNHKELIQWGEPKGRGYRLREDLADYAHEAWAGWMKYLFEKSVLNDDGTITIPGWAVDRWKRQASTHYKDLPPVEKQSDSPENDRHCRSSSL